MTQDLIMMIGGVFVTIMIRFLPFVILKEKHIKHPYVIYLSQMLPYATMGLLVVYVFREVNLKNSPFGIPELVAVFIVILLHKRFNSNLLSIVSGTIIYMIFIQYIFKYML